MFVNNLLDKTKRILLTTRSSQLLSQQIFNTFPQTITSMKLIVTQRNSTDKTQNQQIIVPLLISMENREVMSSQENFFFEKDQENEKNTQKPSDEKKEEIENEASNEEKKDNEDDSDDEDSNDDNRNGGILIPVIELVKGLIPRLVKRPQQSGQ